MDGDADFVAGVLSARGAPVAGLIESNSLPFVGTAGADGRLVIATRAADVQLTGRVTGTALQGTATVTVPVGAITARDVVLAGAVTTAVVTPADGVTRVLVSAQIEIVASAPFDASASQAAAIQLVSVDPSGVASPAAVDRAAREGRQLCEAIAGSAGAYDLCRGCGQPARRRGQAR